jgi:alpha-galactosidase
MTLDLTNPKVQDFVYNTIHNLIVENPGIAYIKWDANHFISNVGSNFLPANKQSHLYIEYQRGLQKVLQRIRISHPDLIMQACASGGGRATYDFMKYFHEFWSSDNTDALSRLYMQWGTSHFYPAMNMASHVSASPNHQTGRVLPLKFRFDVAMTGRLGIEMQPKSLTADELEFSKVAIENYKRIRPVIQFGDLYRLVSPYDDFGMTALMYVSETKEKAVFFGYNMDKNLTYKFPPLKLNGLDPAKKYKITEINKEILSGERKKVRSRVASDNGIFTGEYLTKVGVQINMREAYQSVVIEINEVK